MLLPLLMLIPRKSEDSNTSSPPTVPRRSLCLDPSDSPDRLTERPCKLMMARNLQLTTRVLAAGFCRMLPAALLVILLKQWDTRARKSLWRAGGRRSNAVRCGRPVGRASRARAPDPCVRTWRFVYLFCVWGWGILPSIPIPPLPRHLRRSPPLETHCEDGMKGVVRADSAWFPSDSRMGPQWVPHVASCAVRRDHVLVSGSVAESSSRGSSRFWRQPILFLWSGPKKLRANKWFLQV